MTGLDHTPVGLAMPDPVDDVDTHAEHGGYLTQRLGPADLPNRQYLFTGKERGDFSVVAPCLPILNVSDVRFRDAVFCRGFGGRLNPLELPDLPCLQFGQFILLDHCCAVLAAVQLVS